MYRSSPAASRGGSRLRASGNDARARRCELRDRRRRRLHQQQRAGPQHARYARKQLAIVHQVRPVRRRGRAAVRSRPDRAFPERVAWNIGQIGDDEIVLPGVVALDDVGMIKRAARVHVQPARVVLRDFQRLRGDVGALDDRLGYFGGNRARNRSASDARFENGERRFGRRTCTGFRAQMRDRVFDQMFGFRARNEHVFVHREFASVKSGDSRNVRNRHSRRAFFTERKILLALRAAQRSSRRARRATRAGARARTRAECARPRELRNCFSRERARRVTASPPPFAVCDRCWASSRYAAEPSPESARARSSLSSSSTMWPMSPSITPRILPKFWLMR